MGRPGIVVWAWALGAFLSNCCMCESLCVCRQYFVAVPAVLEAGAETKFCVNVLKLTSPVVVNVTLIAAKSQSLLTLQTCMLDVHTCIDFKVPIVANEEVMDFVVEVKGSIFHSKEVRKVLVKAYNPMTFVQTDKPIYLPGQKVHFRVVTLDTKLRPSSELVSDPNNNRIGQWLNTNSNSKILQLSYSLSPEAREGTYKITVTIGENKIYHTFNVEKYVLPRFDITVKVPEEVSIGQDSFEVKACSKYTFGQPVPGKVKVHMCRPLQRYFPISPLIRVAQPNDQPNPKDETTPVCQSETKQADKTGCAIFKFNISAFTEMEKAVQDILEIKTEKEEEGTGVLISEEKRITITYLIGKVFFIDTPNIYESGAIVEGKVKAVYHNGAPISGNKVYVFEGDRWSPRSVQNVTTDRNGVALFTLHTDDLKGNVQLYASLTSTLDYPGYRTAYYEIGFHTLTVSKPASPDENTVSFLVVKTKDKPLPCKTVQKIDIQYTIVGETPGPVDLIYLVLSRGAIFIQGHKKIDVKSETVNEGEVFFNLNVSPEMAPDIQIVAYAVLPSENVIAQTADFSTEKCFANKVSVDFVPPSAVPGEETDFQVKALPNSLCGVSAIDQSVLIKEPGKTLDAEKIFDLLPVRKLTYIPYEVQDPVECMEVRPKRSILPFPEFDKNDAYTVFQSVGLKMATNMFIQMPSCLRYRGKEYYQGYGFKGGQVYKIDLVHRLPAEAAVAPGIALETSPIKTVRTFFPETWIWELVEVRESGTKNMTLTVPDTITTWETEAFCLSSEGFGLAPPEKMKVFQPFFLELTMPYSIIRGEFFELKATIFSFLTICMMVTVTPTPSSEYILTSLSGDEYTSCLCANERRTVSWSMVPKALGVLNVTISAEAVASGVSCGNELVTVPERGRIDVITKSLIVKVEGVMVTKTYNLLLIPTGQCTFQVYLIRFSLRLLQLPSGCGEQNMILLAPNIFILQYLKSTQQLTPAVEEKATSYMIVGECYQNQLHYKHVDGAYSAFGRGEGNTWLTALVVKCFAQAEEFIYIDPKNIELSKTWLENQQRENGCFKQSGKLFHNGMKVSLHSMEITSCCCMSSVVNKSLACLKEFTNDLSNTYTTALLAYVFTLAGDQVTRAHLLEHLDKVAIKQGSFIYWSQKSVETSTSLSVEISSYVLLAQISSSPTAEELGYASGIVRWLTDQQNYYGGFSSTQDTVVALQALALYSTTLFSIPWGSSKVAVNCPNSQLTFHVNRNNRLLYQEETILKDVAGKYIVEMKGTATVSVQITVQYNIPNSYGSSTLRVEVRVEYHSSRSPRPKLTLIIKSLYSGKESSTNMVILDIKLLSGHVPDPESLRKLKDAPLVDRIEQKEDHVLVYLRELVKDTPVEHSLDLIEEYPVDNLKPAMVVLYDFYEPSKTPFTASIAL
uniref:Alpha-2-macroglobulin bait region domain-containing protein n=1 Tax=Amphilophus citrinellus TaxID=61819 RepID=A0A3Q0RUH5_AMPCI